MEQSIQAVGASDLYPPAFSPDLNYKENLQSESLSAQSQSRPVDELWNEIGRIINAIEPKNVGTTSQAAATRAGETEIL